MTDQVKIGVTGNLAKLRDEVEACSNEMQSTVDKLQKDLTELVRSTAAVKAPIELVGSLEGKIE